jgi:hypothetical protein
MTHLRAFSLSFPKKSIPMSPIKKITHKYYLFEVLVGSVVFAIGLAFMTLILKIPLELGYLVIWAVVLWITYTERRADTEYWIRPEFKSNALGGLSASGYAERCVAGNQILFEKKGRFGMRHFATLTDLSTHITLKVGDAKSEKMMDQHITTDMLSGGKRLVGRRLFRRKAAQATG